MILGRLPNAVGEYASGWGNQLIRVIEANFSSINTEFNTTYRYTPTGYIFSALNTATQTAIFINTPYAVSYNVNALSNGIVLESGSQIKIIYDGTYNIQFSAQLDSTVVPITSLWIWLRKNGTDIANSAGIVKIQGNNASIVFARNYMEVFSAGDYIQLMWAVNNIGTRLLGSAASGFAPAIPSIIMTVMQEART